MKFSFSVESYPQYVVLHPKGKPLTSTDYDPLLKEVDRVIGSGQAVIVLDLSEIALLNSDGLSVLIKIMTRCRNHGGDLFIVNISEKIKQVLVLTKLNSVFNIVASADLVAGQFSKT